MKLTNLLVVSGLLLIFWVCADAQTNGYAHELPGYEFYGKGNLKGIRLLDSTSTDVIRVFGGSCLKQCDYDERWSVKFEYFSDIWVTERHSNKGEKQIYYLDSKYLGTIRVIEIRPKKNVSFLDLSFPGVFEKLIVTSTTDGRSGKSRMTVNDAFHDPDGLTYEIYNRTNYDDIKNRDERSYEKGDLVLIRYNISEDKEKDMFVLQK